MTRIALPMNGTSAGLRSLTEAQGPLGSLADPRRNTKVAPSVWLAGTRVGGFAVVSWPARREGAP